MLSLSPLRSLLLSASIAGLAISGCVAEQAELDKLEGDAEVEDWDLAADSITRPTEMGPIASGSTVNGTFGRNERYLAWTFTANEGDVIEIDANGVTPRWLDTVVSVYRTSAALRPTGRALASNDDCDPSTLGSCIDYTMRESGTFAIVVRRYDRGNSGTFALSLDVTSTVRRCGGRGGASCNADEYCAFGPEAGCGRWDAQGTCTRRPEACTALYRPVCGCDGMTYSNSCSAANRGVSVETDGACVTADCGEQIAAIDAAASEVWFLSESDRPFAVEVFAGEGAEAPTLESVLARAMPPAGATSSVREASTYALHFEPAPGSPDEAPAMLEAAISAALTDLLYVAIVNPENHAEIRVILVGRTSCNDLVWLESISIET